MVEILRETNNSLFAKFPRNKKQTLMNIDDPQKDGTICPLCGNAFLTYFIPLDPFSKENLICGACSSIFRSE
jgi:hypothetical protein